MFPYRTTLKLNRTSKQPLYLQLANQCIQLIKENRLTPNTKLPSSRSLSELLGVHRKTIVACYDELQLQGWVESIPKKGTYVHRNLPVLNVQHFREPENEPENDCLGFSFYRHEHLDSMPHTVSNENWMALNDGISDVRLTPINELSRIYRRISARRYISDQLSYGSTYGNDKLRSVLVRYLNQTRGLSISKEQIVITRGSQMGLFLAAQLLLKATDCIIVGETNYSAADVTFKHQEATLLRVPVDSQGIDTQAIAAICKTRAIKAVYVTSHHHHPTTVTLSAERRLHLLNLAKTHSFAILEDDYDYDFNYNHSPILPLASHDSNGHVIYIGSVCKTVAPVFRVGYLVAPKAFVSSCADVRRIVDRQGDALLELTFAEFIEQGDLDRHIKKVLKVYRTRRDLFCDLLKTELSGFFEFDIPKGGMAVWVKLTEKYSWDVVATLAASQKLSIGNWKRYDRANTGHNAIRIGFASFNENEIYALINKLKAVYKLIR